MNRKFGGISERAHSNFEPEKCVSLKSIFIDFHEIFKNSKAFSGLLRIQDYYERSQKYPVIFGSHSVIMLKLGK